MAEPKAIPLGTGEHTLYSDEEWYFVVDPSTTEIILEARFESDAPDRTGFPTWARTEFCISQAGEKAVCQIPYASAAELLAAARMSFIPEGIWRKAGAECRKLAPAGEGSGP